MKTSLIAVICFAMLTSSLVAMPDNACQSKIDQTVFSCATAVVSTSACVAAPSPLTCTSAAITITKCLYDANQANQACGNRK